MSSLDISKGKKTVIFAAIIAIIVIAAYIFLGQTGQESEEVISKRVRLEVVEEPQTGQTEETAPAGPQDDKETPEQGAITAPAVQEAPAEVAQRPSGVKDARPEPASTRPVAVTEERPAKTAPEPRVEAEKPARPAVKKTEAAEPETEEAESKKTSEKQAEKKKKPSKTVTSKDISARPWAVGLASFKTLDEAQSVAGSIKAQHHNAYITETVKDGRKWYRVRVGFYATREEAEKVGKSLSARYGFHNIWVVKPAKDETKAHFK